MGRKSQLSLLTALLFSVGCRPSTTTLDQSALASLQALVDSEIQRLIGESRSRAVQDSRDGIDASPTTTPEEIQREVSAGVAYVVTRISNGKAIFVLLSEIEYSRLRPGFVSYGMNKVELINPYSAEFRLPFEIYKEPLSTPAMRYQRAGREVALRWFFSHGIHPVNRIP